MRKILMLCMFVAICMNIASCKVNKGKVKNREVVEDSVIPIQSEVLGFKLGVTNPSDAQKNIFMNNWEYFTSDFEGEYGIDVTSRLTFGGLSWRGVGLSFLNNKLYLISFNDDTFDFSEKEHIKRYNILFENLKKKYKKAKIGKFKFEAEDDKYVVLLEYDSLKRMSLTYAIRDDKVGKLIPTDL